MDFIDLKQQYHQIKADVDRRISHVISHGQFILGPEVRELELKLADYVGVEHVIGCANGTDALLLCLLALGVKPGDAVFCPSFTFFATAEVVELVGARPVFVDVDESTFNIDWKDLERRISLVMEEGRLNPKAVICVDLFGLPANFPNLAKICDKYDIALIEDGAQGMGGSLSGQRACSFGLLSTTSFFPAKPLGCYGDGGAIFTNNKQLAEELYSLREHGRGQDKYNNIRFGLNSRLDTIQAAVLLAKLEVFSQECSNRQWIAATYFDRLIPEAGLLPFVPEGYVSGWAQFTMRSGNRDEFCDLLGRHGIPTAVYYRTSLHQMPVFEKKYGKVCFPVSESLSKTVYSVPVHPYMSEADVAKVCATIEKVAGMVG